MFMSCICSEILMLLYNINTSSHFRQSHFIELEHIFRSVIVVLCINNFTENAMLVGWNVYFFNEKLHRLHNPKVDNLWRNLLWILWKWWDGFWLYAKNILVLFRKKFLKVKELIIHCFNGSIRHVCRNRIDNLFSLYTDTTL